MIKKALILFSSVLIAAFVLTGAVSADELGSEDIPTEIECDHSLYSQIVEDEIAPTCTSVGKTETIYCSNCNEVISGGEEIPMIDHTYGEESTVPPTFAREGYRHRYCEVCGFEDKYDFFEQLVLSNVTGLKMTANTPNSISMSWTKVSDATGYVVYQAIDGKWQRIKVTSGNTFTVSNLKAGTNYRFTVKAYVTFEGKNYYCPGYTGVWMTTLPAKPAAKMTINTAQAIRLEWDKITGATGYVVYKMEGGKWVKKAVTKNNVYVFSGLAGGTDYNFAVRAYKTFYGTNYYSPFTTSQDTVKSATLPATVSYSITPKAESAVLSWNKVNGATGYKVYYRENGQTSWKLVKTTTGTSYTISKLTGGKKYDFTVKAYRIAGGITYNGKYTVKTATPQYAYKLYTITKNASIYTKAKNLYGCVSKGFLYTGHYDYKFPGYIVINYKSSELLIKNSCVSARNNAKVLPTGSIGQYGGKITGYAACGPTAVAILLNSEKKAGWDKDDLILYSEKNKLNDQGSLRSGGGMTAPRLLELINGYSKGKYTAKNIYSTKVSSSTTLKNQIDAGHRAIVVVQYRSSVVTYTGSATHFIVICGYENINGTLYFYYADPYFGGGSRSLRMVDASTLNVSMGIVKREPRTLIVLN